MIRTTDLRKRSPGVEELRSRGFAIEHIQRVDRTGFKAGALAAGLLRSDAPFVALFDSDFRIPSDFFRQLIPEFRGERVAFVQARWGFANADENFLTRIQSLMLDAHFSIEHRVRSLGGRFFNFNGTAGIWRRKAIDDAGGWRSDSITEDLDLSLRAWLAGWEFRYRDDVVAESDLPTGMRAYRTQQNRWISGSIQVATTNLTKILSLSGSYGRGLDLLLGVTGNLCYPLIVLLAFLLPHAIAIRLAERDRLLLYADVPFFLFATGSVALFYWCARRDRSAWATLVQIPALMALGLGMTLHNSRAVFRGVTGGATVFERTPKGGSVPDSRGRENDVISGDVQTRLKLPKRRFEVLPWLECAMFAYLCSIGLYRAEVALFSLPLVGLLTVGYGVVVFHRR